MSNREAKRTKKRAREMIAEGEELLAKHKEHEEAKKARKIMQEEEAQKEEASRMERERLEAEHEARRAAWNSAALPAPGGRRPPNGSAGPAGRRTTS